LQLILVIFSELDSDDAFSNEASELKFAIGA